ncbi:hypothetical protein NDU88_003577 [Pleurodeles waltl]|uniref:Uncharacterized protein n=1 Tax=Pleurodeles waltl TaxID=8319 RepID=A0AAV7VDP6_PLEWA|nr:hypothetical protein NDU88_003577 [Pleurodeles waltl]
MEDRSNTGVKKHTMAADQLLPNDQRHEIVRVYPNEIGEQAVLSIEEAEDPKGPWIRDMAEGGEEDEVATERDLNRKLPAPIHQLALEERRSFLWSKGVVTQADENKDVPKWNETYNRKVTERPEKRHQLQETLTQGSSTQLNRTEQEGRQEVHLRTTHGLSPKKKKSDL